MAADARRQGQCIGLANGEATGGVDRAANEEAGTEHLADRYTDAFNWVAIAVFPGEAPP